MNNNNNNKKTTSNSINILKNLNEFKSQSARDHTQFLDDYYKNKCNKTKLDLESNIIDLNRNLSQMNNSLYTMGTSVSTYLSSNFNKLFIKNSNYSSVSSGIDVQDPSSSMTTTVSNNASTIDADSTSYQDVDLSASPCLAISNRIDKIGSSFYADNNNDVGQVPERRKSNSIKINNRTNHDDTSEDFIFVNTFKPN
jgi:hypothetical protein